MWARKPRNTLEFGDKNVMRNIRSLTSPICFQIDGTKASAVTAQCDIPDT